MTWVYFSIAAALIWAVVNIVDKYILTKWIKSPLVMTANVAVTSIIISVLIFAFRPSSRISTTDILFSLAAGVLYILGNFTYMKAVLKEEISKVIPLIYVDPLFTAILAVIFLHESLSPLKYLGIILLVCGAMLISTSKLKFNFNKSFFYAILTALIFAAGSVLMKTPLNHTDFWTVFAYTRLGVFLGMVVLLPTGFKEFAKTFREIGKKMIFVFLNETLSVLGTLLFIIAIASGYVSLSNALTATQPFFVFIFALIISVFYPYIFKEELDKKIIATKIAAIVIIFLGTTLII